MRRSRHALERFARAAALCAAMGLLALAPQRVMAQHIGPSLESGVLQPTEAGAEVVLRALSLLGVDYRFGGNTPDTGLDCSGLVRFVFEESLGIPLPRRSEEMSRVGSVISPRELQPGDLVFFNTLRRAFSHVGIYIGENRFVHAPSAGKRIRVESLGSSYWVRRFNGARRILDEDSLALAALHRRDPLVAAGLIPLPAQSARVARAPVRPALAVAARTGPLARTSGRPATAIVPLRDLRGFGTELTMN